MEVYVKVTCQNSETGEERLTTTAIITMVAVNDEGKPTKIKGVIPETEEEKALFSTAAERKERRLMNRLHA